MTPGLIPMSCSQGCESPSTKNQPPVNHCCSKAVHSFDRPAARRSFALARFRCSLRSASVHVGKDASSQGSRGQQFVLGAHGKTRRQKELLFAHCQEFRAYQRRELSAKACSAANLPRFGSLFNSQRDTFTARALKGLLAFLGHHT